MESSIALSQLSALAQENRLAVLRLLVKAGPEGMAAGEVAVALGVPANTLSAQLNILSNAGLVAGERRGRSIIYSAQYGAVSGLIVFLMEDCCQGQPEICAPVMKAAQAACC